MEKARYSLPSWYFSVPAGWKRACTSANSASKGSPTAWNFLANDSCRPPHLVALRPFDLAWARNIREQCRAVEVPFFLKQLGGNPVEKGSMLRLRDRHGGDWSEWPEDLRIREIPSAFQQ